MSDWQKETILNKIRKYCAYQERSHQEVRHKLIEMNVYGHDLEEIMAELIREDYLNEERFARSYARGKFRMNKWGKNKIRIKLKQKQISPYNILKGLEEIDDQEYEETIETLVKQYVNAHNRLDKRKLQKNLNRYLYSRGFESELFSPKISELLSSH